jgi:RNA-directed DNA polymerase
MAGTQEPDSVSTKYQRIAAQARTHPDRAFVSLAHHIDLDWLYEAYRRTRKSGAVGVDGETVSVFSATLDARLRDLLEAAKSGLYQAPPVRRVHIPKGDGRKTRPIGIPTFADKVLQRAVAMVLEAVYEQDFHPDSYGFRPGRSAHQMLAALHRRLTRMGGGWVIELDIRSYFDTIDHALLRQFVQRRVRDGVITRLIGKWLQAGVMEDGQWHRSEAGSPQGGVISPLLANVYLHEVLDEWFMREVQPRLAGRSFMLRYADDAVLVFANEADARRVLDVLAKRFGRFGLTLHPDKTRLVAFRPSRGDDDGAGFDLLGFTHYWGRSRSGRWVIQRKTAKDRFRRALERISDWCRQHRHWRLRDQHEVLTRKLQGHWAYFGLSGNYRALASLRYRVERVWLKWLGRRSQRGHVPWDRAAHLLTVFALPRPRIVHRSGFP